ncbi:family 43 glycosylhydrolase [Streptomyces sp. H27-G5]|uniref:family 43 glycosylhydrolase n=1 Tax=Streptomyces sp. H27-G5 TaxID=2996698 RepID=UPI00226F56CA|nr:family 43 glycosylhydrolase [Streptomyces sp. H27-G5]MCY0919195.1 family 43 glycosylhydrolase [Streptomyces sp. H27-G5]
MARRDPRRGFRRHRPPPGVCPVAAGGAIDAANHTESGRRYLLWKSDGNCCETDTWIHLQPTTWDGTRTTGEPVRLIRQDRDWEGSLVEAPTLVKRGDHYVLFYSADAYGGDGYKIGYAGRTPSPAPARRRPPRW